MSERGCPGCGAYWPVKGRTILEQYHIESFVVIGRDCGHLQQHVLV